MRVVDLCLASEGTEVILATSSDEKYPPENMIDGNSTTFWTTTGMFPQEFIICFHKHVKIERLFLQCYFAVPALRQGAPPGQGTPHRRPKGGQEGAFRRMTGRGGKSLTQFGSRRVGFRGRAWKCQKVGVWRVVPLRGVSKISKECVCVGVL
ncbi:intraflagellar transport protein 25 homolog isoform 1-T2 [Sarcophilus harrisii]